MQANIKTFFAKRKGNASAESDSSKKSDAGKVTEDVLFLDDSSDDSNISESDEEPYSESERPYAGPERRRIITPEPAETSRPPGPSDISSGRLDKPVQPSSCVFPVTRFGTSKRSFRSAWYQQHTWLEYSVSQDAAYCFSCRNFPVPNKSRSENNFTLVGYRQWKNATEKDAGFAQHERSDYHSLTFTAWKEFEARVKQGKTIEASLSTEHGKIVSENRHYIKVVAKVLCLTARQKIAQRGHREDKDSENKGNFLEIMEAISDHDDIVKKKLRFRNNYTSSKIQNEVLDILAEMIRTEISQEVNASSEYAVMMDETKDISKKEQGSVVIRYMYDNSIHEEFLGFIHLKQLNAEHLKDKLYEILTNCGINPANCVAQTYDGASVMSGGNRGVQALFREEHAPHAVYIHCYNHRLNLVLVESVKSVKKADNFFSFIQELYMFMSSHTAHELFLQEQQEQATSKQPQTLKKLSDTRWACQYMACKVILDTLPCIVSTLDKIAETHSGKRAHDARCLLASLTFDIIVCLAMFTHLLQRTKLLSDMLQSPSLNLSAAADMIDSVTEDLASERQEDTWKSIWQRAINLAHSVSIDTVPPAPRRVRRIPDRLKESVVMTTTGQQDVVSQEEEYRSKLFYPVLDRILAELATRFDEPNKSLLRSISCLEPSSPHFLDCQKLTTMAEQFAINTEYISVELRQAKRLVDRKTSESQEIRSMVAFSSFLAPYKEAFPDLYRLLNIALVMPPTSASCERSFSSLRMIKNYLRSTVCDTKLDSLGVIAIHHKRAKKLSLDLFLDRFVGRHNNRKIQLF